MGKITYCCVPGCKNVSIKMYAIPTGRSDHAQFIQSIWVERIGNASLAKSNIKSSFRICKKHFAEMCFERSGKLRKFSLPTLCLPNFNEASTEFNSFELPDTEPVGIKTPPKIKDLINSLPPASSTIGTSITPLKLDSQISPKLKVLVPKRRYHGRIISREFGESQSTDEPSTSDENLDYSMKIEVGPITIENRPQSPVSSILEDALVVKKDQPSRSDSHLDYSIKLEVDPISTEDIPKSSVSSILKEALVAKKEKACQTRKKNIRNYYEKKKRDEKEGVKTNSTRNIDVERKLISNLSEGDINPNPQSEKSRSISTEIESESQAAVTHMDSSQEVNSQVTETSPAMQKHLEDQLTEVKEPTIPPTTPSKRKRTPIQATAVVKEVKKGRFERSYLLKELLRLDNSNSKEAGTPITTFFQSIALTVEQLPPDLQTRAKLKVLHVISELEFEHQQRCIVDNGFRSTSGS